MVTVARLDGRDGFVTWNKILRLDSDRAMHSPRSVPPASTALIAAAAQANLVLVAQGIEAVSRFGDDHYTVPVAGCFNSSAGGHFRHAIEHYQALLGAWSGEGSGRLDYENRARDPLIETCAEQAIAAWRRIEQGLAPLAAGTEADRTLHMAAETAEGGVLVTSLARELEFLVNHTVHHFALIAVIAHARGVALPADFGLAPSTLKYRQAFEKICAR